MSLSPDPSATRILEGASSTQPTKRRRLNLACNYCRSRKTRCDEQKPSCHACLAAGLLCITTDPKRPDRHIERREAGKKPGTRNPNFSPVQTLEDDNAQRQANDSATTVSPENAPVTMQVDVERERAPGRGLETRQEQATSASNHANGERYRGMLPIMKHDTSSSTVEILTGWLNVALFRLGLKTRLTFGHSRSVDQPHIPFPARFPQLADPSQHRAQVSNYFRRVNTVYPILDQDEGFAVLDITQTHGADELTSKPESVAYVIVALLVLDLGSSGLASPSYTSFGVYMFCKDMLGRLISHQSIPNIKALFLLALGMYHHDDLASAWPILSLCVSMATAIGLNKSRPTSASARSSEEDGWRRLWWSIFIFEKLLAFELGRQSVIVGEISQPEPTALPCYTAERHPESRPAENDQISTQDQQDALAFFKALIGLAKLLHEIISRCIHLRDREETCERDEIQRIVAEKVKVTGESCLQLTRWAESLPDNLRPSSDLIYDGSTFPHAAFLSLHYNYALLFLTRNSLLISESARRVTTDVISKNQPWASVIRNGQSMAANSARRLVKLFIEAEEIGTPLLIPHVNASLHALYVLGVHLLRNPKSRLAEADLNLISHAVDFAKQHRNPLTVETNTPRDLDRILGELSDVLKHNMGAGPVSSRSGHVTPGRQEQDLGPGPRSEDSHQNSRAPMSFAIPSKTFTDAVGSVEGGFLGRVPGVDTTSPIDIDDSSVFEAGYSYGMDMGTWMDLDGLGWDWSRDVFPSL